MSARYLIRLDDACPTMRHEHWNRIESMLDLYGIAPIVAVIPDNQDKHFNDHLDPDFWNRVAGWQAKGWSIALHGYRHEYVTRDPGIVPINNFSEFAGLPVDVQCAKIRNAWEIFNKHGITPTMWVAPAHSFDENTLQALHTETTIRTISDGIAIMPYFDRGFFWIPQQLWKFRNMPCGCFTICVHPDTMCDSDFTRLTHILAIHQKQFIKVGDVVRHQRPKRWVDKIFAWVWWQLYERKK